MSTPEGRRFASAEEAFAVLFPEPPRSREWIKAGRARRERREVLSLPSPEEFAERVSSRVMAKFDERHGIQLKNCWRPWRYSSRFPNRLISIQKNLNA